MTPAQSVRMPFAPLALIIVSVCVGVGALAVTASWKVSVVVLSGWVALVVACAVVGGVRLRAPVAAGSRGLRLTYSWPGWANRLIVMYLVLVILSAAIATAARIVITLADAIH
jgi:hypothetical protein